MTKIDIDNKLKIVWYTHSGAIYRKDFNKVWDSILGLEEIVDHNYDLLADYRFANFNFGIDDITAITNYLLSVKHKLENKLFAAIANNPYSAAILLLILGKIENNGGFEVKVFSTEKEALYWLSLRK